jgi:hypothetical protein
MTSWTNPRTWADGTVVTAAQLNTDIRDNTVILRANALSGMGELIETLNPSGSSGITTATLPATYDHLAFVAYDLVGSASVEMYIQFNSDTGANYRTAGIGRDSHGTTVAVDNDSATGIVIGHCANGTNEAGFIRGYIMSYNNTTLIKYAHAVSWAHIWEFSAGGGWTGGFASAINTITFYPASGTFSGTICVYGLND